MRFYETIQYIIIVVGLYDFRYPVVFLTSPQLLPGNPKNSWPTGHRRLWNSDLDWDSRALVPEFRVIWEDAEKFAGYNRWRENLENTKKCCV